MMGNPKISLLITGILYLALVPVTAGADTIYICKKEGEFRFSLMFPRSAVTRAR
jgi:hypothetical protein